MEATSKNIVLIDKPKGITSFDCIRRLRPVLGVKKMGHAGTLDPLATGLMIIGVGRKGTKELNELSGLDKTYIVTAKLGEKTTTGDAEGEVKEKRPVKIDTKEIEKEVVDLKGEHKIPVPVYSAVKKKGKPLYWYARKGISVTPPRKLMVVKESFFEDAWDEEDAVYVRFRVKVSSGTYVRSLVEELGRRMGVPATTSDLRRETIGDYLLGDAHSLEDIESGRVTFDIES